ncbi:hypothetical protein [Arthrobacter zhaoguopingii]|uniref:hypothetical protein n=1 Tax=Arthrobacter zhaoguopingii TaxID=2681491 RepID=UPI001359A9E9|nr:hypothetical protein [Arthrobacter zhaoguopingii]
MTDNTNSIPEGDPDEEGAEKAGGTENLDAGGYGGPDPEVEIAPGFDGGKGSDGQK